MVVCEIKVGEPVIMKRVKFHLENLSQIFTVCSLPSLLHWNNPLLLLVIFMFSVILYDHSLGQALNIPFKEAGISFGNSKVFNGLRFNIRDRQVQKINGMNITFWKAKENKDAQVNGVSFGLLPEAGWLRGVQLGLLGVSAEQEIRGISLGLLGTGSGDNFCGLAVGGLGVGAGNNMTGIMIGGLGAGSGGKISGITICGLGAGASGNIKGVTIGGLGVGSGGNLTGIAVGGLGAGASGDINGFTFGLLGAGAGENITGITIGGLGAGASENITGITIGGLGAGCGGDIKGVVLAGLGAGCGDELQGVALTGVGAGAPTVRGMILSLLFAGGNDIQGITLAGLNLRVKENGSYSGFSASAFNYIKGRQTGLSVGILNYSWHLNGVQLGILNYVKDNPRFLKILPLVNAHFD
jgi:hypothetical protein